MLENIPSTARLNDDNIWRWAEMSRETPDPWYRYALGRQWGDGPRVLFVQLNPSKADGLKDDPTLRRNIGFAKAWGYGSCVVANLYAWRSTKPQSMFAAERYGRDIVGPDNDTWISKLLKESILTIACWGARAKPGRVDHVLRILRSTRDVYAIRILPRSSTPEHPLYLPKSLRPVLLHSRIDLVCP